MRYYRQYQHLGLHRNINPLLVVQGEWNKLINWDIEKVGCATKRKGYQRILNCPDGHEVLSLIPFKQRLIMITRGGNLYSAKPLTDSSWGSPRRTGLHTGIWNKWTGTVFHDSNGQEFLILGNGYEVFKTSDGLTFTGVSGAPHGRFWTSFQERVFCSGVPADNDVLHWCSIGDMTNWSTVSPNDSSSLNIDKYAGGKVRGIKMLNDRVVIWKDNIIKRWDGEYLRSVMCSEGIGAPYSLSDIAGMAFTLDRNAIRLYDGNSPREISSKIEDLVYGINLSNNNNRPRICGQVFRRKYHLSVGNITDDNGEEIKNAWIVYDYNKNMFWTYSLKTQAVAMAVLEDDDSNEFLFFGDKNGNVYKMFEGDTDNGEEIEAYMESHILYPEGTESYIEPKKFFVASKFGHEIKAQIRTDYEDNPQNIGEFDEPVTENIMNLGNHVRGFKVSIAHSTKGRPIFYGFTLGYEKEGAKDTLS